MINSHPWHWATLVDCKELQAYSLPLLAEYYQFFCNPNAVTAPATATATATTTTTLMNNNFVWFDIDWHNGFIPQFTWLVITYPCWELNYSVLVKEASEVVIHHHHHHRHNHHHRHHYHVDIPDPLIWWWIRITYDMIMKELTVLCHTLRGLW